MIRCDVIPRSRASVKRRTDSAHDGFEQHAARGMRLRVEEDLDVTNALLARTGEIGGGEIVEIAFVDEDRARPVIDVQERLQVAEPCRPA